MHTYAIFKITPRNNPSKNISVPNKFGHAIPSPTAHWLSARTYTRKAYFDPAAPMGNWVSQTSWNRNFSLNYPYVFFFYIIVHYYPQILFYIKVYYYPQVFPI